MNEKLSEIVASVSKVTDIVAEIAAAAKEQSAGIDQINQAMTQMNAVTLQPSSPAMCHLTRRWTAPHPPWPHAELPR